MKKPVWSGDWPIPARIHLPGCRVRVKVVSPGDRKVLNGCDGATVYSHEKDTCVVLIDGSLPLELQRGTLVHELGHVVVELRDIMLEHFPTQVCWRSTYPAAVAALVPKDTANHPEPGKEEAF